MLIFRNYDIHLQVSLLFKKQENHKDLKVCLKLIVILFVFNLQCKMIISPVVMASFLLLARLESAYSLIWGSHEIWRRGGGDTLAFL